MVAGVILAGGVSKRFGSDKRYFKLNGNTLLEAACDKMTKVCENNYIVADKYFFVRRNKPKGITALMDLEDGKGPLMGIYTALTHLAEEGCLVIPVDMPELSIALLEHIKEQENLFDLAIPYSDEFLPLPGYYSVKLLPLIKYALDEGGGSIKFLATQAEKNTESRVLRITFEAIKKFGDPNRLLLNINRIEDIEKLGGYFGEEPKP